MNQDRPRRREYSKQFKAEVLTRCAQPGASVGGVALAQGLHSNMVHRWIREQRERQALAPPAFVPLRMPTVPFIPAALPAKQAEPAGEQSLPEVDLQIQRGELLVRLQCPLSQCGALLRELLR
ncbi:transposase [Acidovorax sp. T1]|uniref:transposase n=2 Tax=unclassified Acidovorax TaxID=2684926 RepID=UPI001E28592E|nr:transposase [Acidovorax sp. T1]